MSAPQPVRDPYGVPRSDYATSLTLDNVPSEEVGRILDLLSAAGYTIEINVGVGP